MKDNPNKFYSQKKIFKLILLLFVFLLMLLPFVTTFNSLLTDLLGKFGVYHSIEKWVVPFEAKSVVIILRYLGIEAVLTPNSGKSAFYLIKEAVKIPVVLQWNCLGWQSLVLLLSTLLVGFQGNFTKLSMLESALIGLLGTYLINIARMVAITVGIYHVNSIFALLIHDYIAAATTVIWLFFFWWFSYAFVLSENQTK